jgi:hypothetical protein
MDSRVLAERVLEPDQPIGEADHQRVQEQEADLPDRLVRHDYDRVGHHRHPGRE